MIAFVLVFVCGAATGIAGLLLYAVILGGAEDRAWQKTIHQK